MVRFAAIGVVSTLAYLLLFVLLRGAMGAQAANLLALLSPRSATPPPTAGSPSAAGRTPLRKYQLQGLVVFGLGLALTSGSLAVLSALSTAPASALELACSSAPTWRPPCCASCCCAPGSSRAPESMTSHQRSDEDLAMTTDVPPRRHAAHLARRARPRRAPLAGRSGIVARSARTSRAGYARPCSACWP